MAARYSRAEILRMIQTQRKYTQQVSEMIKKVNSLDIPAQEKADRIKQFSGLSENDRTKILNKHFRTGPDLADSRKGVCISGQTKGRSRSAWNQKKEQ